MALFLRPSMPGRRRPPSWRWADLPADLLCLIGDRLDLKFYASARGACTAWRCALSPPSPSLLVGGRFRISAASLPTSRSFGLNNIPLGALFAGSSNGWLALFIGDQGYDGQSMFSLFNPITGTEILLPPLIYKKTSWVSKIVFAPNPARDDFAAAAICDIGRLAYVTAGARRWAILDPVPLASGDQLADVVYHEKHWVYCLTRCGHVHVLPLPKRRCRKPVPVAVEDPAGPSEPEIPLGRAARGVLVDGRWRERRLQNFQWIDLAMIPPGSVGEDLNAPAKVEPMLSEGNLPFDPATCFAPPYNKVALYASAKNLVFCNGNLYQIWRNASHVTLQMPGGGRLRLAENEILVLRYYPRRQPCWNAVMDLGGYSVFVGRNNAVSMYAVDVSGLKGNCVYWIGGRGRDQGMIFDMATRRSTPCLPVAGAAVVPGPPQSTICWYFLSDIVNNCNISAQRKVYQTRARVRAEREQDLEE